MQRSEFTSTKIELGSAYVQIHKINPHAKFAPPAGFCSGGCGWVTLTQNLTCPICKKPVTKTKRSTVMTEAIRQFEEFIRINSRTLDNSIFNSGMILPFSWSGKSYNIPISMIREYIELKDSSEPDPYRKFFEAIKPLSK